MHRPFPEILPGAFALVLSTVVATVLLANADLDQRLSLVTPSSHFCIVSADDNGEAGDDEDEGGGAWTGAFDRLGEAALLHDVGKIGVPDAMLHKSGPLDDEFRVIQMHPVRGDDILGSSNGAGIGRAVVRHHHEKSMAAAIRTTSPARISSSRPASPTSTTPSVPLAPTAPSEPAIVPSPRSNKTPAPTSTQAVSTPSSSSSTNGNAPSPPPATSITNTAHPPRSGIERSRPHSGTDAFVPPKRSQSTGSATRSLPPSSAPAVAQSCSRSPPRSAEQVSTGCPANLPCGPPCPHAESCRAGGTG